MKKLLTLVVLLMTTISFGQYSENFGTPSGTSAVTITNYVTGTAPATFQNTTPISYSNSTCDIRKTASSTGTTGTTPFYNNASGNGNAFFALVGGKTLQIDGLNTTSTQFLSFGYLTSNIPTITPVQIAQIVLEYSTDSTTWTPLTFTNNTNTSWGFIYNLNLPSTSSLSLRFTGPATTSGIRIDDIQITSTALSTSQNQISGLQFYPNPTKNILNITTDLNSTKNVEIYDMIGKKVLVEKITIINPIMYIYFLESMLKFN